MLLESKKFREFLRSQLVTHMDYSEDYAKKEVNYLESWFDSLPDELKLFRIVLADDKKDIDLDKPGSHYGMNRKGLVNSHQFATGVGDKTFLLTVIANKSLIDKKETLHNRALYPHENEITLKNKGKGIKILSIKELV
jgi:hypothetical protein